MFFLTTNKNPKGERQTERKRETERESEREREREGGGGRACRAWNSTLGRDYKWEELN